MLNKEKLILLLSLIFVPIIAVFATKHHFSSPIEEVSTRLSISTEYDEDAYFNTEIPLFDGTNLLLCYDGLTNVTVSLNETSVNLEDALRDGGISLGQILSIAQLDTQASICTTRWNSRNGLAHFCYSYPGFDLWITNDIYETPDGHQHLIRDITLAQPGSDVTFVYNDLDQEDWGIAFSVADASPSEITLNYTQSGGQQIGQLMTCGYQISNLDRNLAVQELDSSNLQEQMPISMNSQGSLTLDIETHFGLLPAGEYGMYLYILDQYEETNVPPLTRNYHDMQCYWIEFIIS